MTGAALVHCRCRWHIETIRLLIAMVAMGGLFLFPAMAPDPACAAEKNVVVVVSKSIRPYLEAAGGLSQILSPESDVVITQFMLDRFAEAEARVALAGRVARLAPNLLVAIGPDALRFAWSTAIPAGIPKIYAMALNPANILASATDDACGVALNIAPDRQLGLIQQCLPNAARIGLLFDPGHNEDFFQQAQAAAEAIGVRLVALRISDKTQIQPVLAANKRAIDALWIIPDRTVVSASIIRFVIKESLLHNVPVIGFNRFFYENGAAVAFVLDYAQIGRQCGDLALDVLDAQGCQSVPPAFSVWLNQRVFDRLKIALPQPYAPPIQEGP